MATTTGISFDGVNDEVAKTWSGKTVSNNKKFTFAAWLELPTGTGENAIFSADTQSAAGAFQCGLVGNASYGGLTSTQTPFLLFQDESSAVAILEKGAATLSYGVKYFLMVVVDTAQATASNRIKVWFGPYGGAITQQTWTFLFSTTWPAQNAVFNHGSGSSVAHDNVGSESTGTFYKGREADVYWLDNVALADPSSLLNNYASAAAPGTYAGSYGNTGYHLDFSNSGSLGADSSGNSNTFTPAGGPTQLTSYFPAGGTTLAAAAGSYSITGTAATLRRGKVLSAAAGSYAVTGTAATLRRARKTAAAAGSYSVTGTAAGVKRGRKTGAGAGSYSVTGTAAGVKRGRKTGAGAGSYSVTGTAAGVKRGRKTGAGAGSYSVTGTAATLRKGWVIGAGAGSYAIAGTAATLSKGSAKVLGADPGSYAITGTAAGIRAGRKIAAGVGAYAVTGTAATLRRGLAVPAGAGSYSVTGTSATLAKSNALRVTADPGSYAITGTAATLRRELRLSANVGSYALTGVSASLRRGRALGAGAGSYSITGTAAAIRRERRLGASAGTYAITGTAATLTYVPSASRVYYPSGYPQPLIAGFSASIAMGVIRAQGPTDQAQRRVHTTMPHTFSLTFIMSVAQWGLWNQWVMANGYNWFFMSLPTFYAGLSSGTLSPVLIRFTSGIMANNVSGSDVQVTVTAESAPSMIAQYLEAV